MNKSSFIINVYTGINDTIEENLDELCLILVKGIFYVA